MSEDDQKLLVSTDEMAKRLNLSRSAFYALHSSGKLGPMPRRLTRKPLWSVAEFEAWIAASCPIRPEWQKTRVTKNVLAAERG